MDIKPNEPRELDEQEQLGEEYAELVRKRMQGMENFQKKGSGFTVGLLLGSAMTFLLVSVVLLGGWALGFGEKKQPQNSRETEI